MSQPAEPNEQATTPKPKSGKPPLWSGESLDNWNNTEVLTMLLRMFVPRVDAALTAQQLIDRFGSLFAVFHAKADALKSVGLSDPTIQWLCFIQAFYYRYLRDRVKYPQRTLRFASISQFGEYCVTQLSHQFNEVLLIFYLDQENTVIYADEVSSSLSHRVVIDIEKIVRTALLYHASSVALAHNHPNGELNASAEDISITKQIQSILSYLDITLFQHIIVSNKQYQNVLLQRATR